MFSKRQGEMVGIVAALVVVLAIIGVVIMQRLQKEITADQARANIQQGLYDYIVDVRTTAEWNADHLPDTISIPIGDLVTELPAKIPNKDARILFICKRGVRASGVVTIAEKLGYRRVQALVGNYGQLRSA